MQLDREQFLKLNESLYQDIGFESFNMLKGQIFQICDNELTIRAIDGNLSGFRFSKILILCDGVFIETVSIFFRCGDWVLVQQQEGSLNVVLVGPNINGSFDEGLQDKKEWHRKWILFISQIKDIMNQLNIDEVMTPTRVPCPGFEPNISCFGADNSYFLRSSPELSLKQLLAKGWGDIYELRSVFRDESIPSDWHLSEFHMLEWYRNFKPLDSLVDDICFLLKKLDANVSVSKYSVADLFKTHLDFLLLPSTSQDQLWELNKKKGGHVDRSESWEDSFFKLFLQFIEPSFSKEDIVCIYDFPPQLSAMAQINEKGWALRMEVYFRGIEIANGYQELRDPAEQRQRAANDLSLKNKNDGKGYRDWPDFHSSLDAGLPPCAGMALGVERLFSILNGLSRVYNSTLL